MMSDKILNITTRREFRSWLIANHDKQSECFVVVKIGRPQNDGRMYYLDAVEEALCFGWIDGMKKNIAGYGLCQRFSPRKCSNFSELNKARCERLEKLGLMTDAGRCILQKFSKDFSIDVEVFNVLKQNNLIKLLGNFSDLYVRIKLSNIQQQSKVRTNFEKSLKNFIEKTNQIKMYGNWNDYGRLKCDKMFNIDNYIKI